MNDQSASAHVDPGLSEISGHAVHTELADQRARVGASEMWPLPRLGVADRGVGEHWG